MEGAGGKVLLPATCVVSEEEKEEEGEGEMEGASPNLWVSAVSCVSGTVSSVVYSKCVMCIVCACL